MASSAPRPWGSSYGSGGSQAGCPAQPANHPAGLTSNLDAPVDGEEHNHWRRAGGAGRRSCWWRGGHD